MRKLEIVTNQSGLLHRPNVPKVSMGSLMILNWSNINFASMETGYITKMLYLSKDESPTRNISTFLFSTHKTKSLSRHKQVYIMRLRFKR